MSEIHTLSTFCIATSRGSFVSGSLHRIYASVTASSISVTALYTQGVTALSGLCQCANSLHHRCDCSILCKCNGIAGATALSFACATALYTLGVTAISSTGWCDGLLHRHVDSLHCMSYGAMALCCCTPRGVHAEWLFPPLAQWFSTPQAWRLFPLLVPTLHGQQFSLCLCCVICILLFSFMCCFNNPS